MRMFKVVTLLVLAALVPCSGAVIYELTGTSGVQFAVSFQLTTPSFITTDTTVPAAGLDVCSTTFEACSSVSFSPISLHDNNFSHIEFFTTTTATLFFFDLGSFTAPGSYNTSFGLGEGTLTVTEIDDVVPEPASVTLMLGGIAGLLAARRYRR